MICRGGVWFVEKKALLLVPEGRGYWYWMGVVIGT